jgi:CBS domain-containing protein
MPSSRSAKRPEGLVSLSRRPAAMEYHPSDRGSRGLVRVRDLMQTKLVTIAVGERLSTVEDIMTLGGVRHMPVVQGGKLVGVVSQRDLLRASLSNLEVAGTEERRAFLSVVEIRRVMSAPPVTITPDASVEEAASIMAERKIGCLPVVVEEELVGLVTETDVLRYVASFAHRSGS